jgi:glyoxylase-like metal-dependent hydrolase (beta-lactamase superfamily II)
VLHDGDDIAGFRVVHAPGHTPGHVAFFRARDRVLIAGDVLANYPRLGSWGGLNEPPHAFSIDPAQNRRSIAKLAELRPRLVCFGHGPPLTDLKVLDRVAETLAPANV